MSVGMWLAMAILLVVAVLAIALARAHRRLGRVEARARRLEDLVCSELEPGLEAARSDARAAAATARDAAIAAGVQPPRAPRLVLEPVTGPVVRAVAFGASARRVIVRIAAPWSRRHDARSSL